jgi:hypothetical protein
MEFHIKRYDIPDVEQSVKDSEKGYLNEDPFKFGMTIHVIFGTDWAVYETSVPKWQSTVPDIF